MATLQENIRRVNSDFQAIKAKIVEKGVEVADGTKTSEYASKVDAVYEAGKKAVGEVLKFADVASTAYRSIVPNGVEPFAKVSKIGGMTYKSKNLFEYPYANTTLTSAGITFTDNGDGSITLNGTNDGVNNSAFYIYKKDKQVTLSAGTYTTSIANYNGGAIIIMGLSDDYYVLTNKPLTVDKDTDFQIYIQVSKGNTTVFNNVTIYPMLNEGSTPLPYEPYFAGLRSAKVDELKSKGANLFEYPYYSKTTTSAGITFTDNGDGSITINGTNDGTGNSAFFIYHDTKPTHLPAGTYTASAFGSNGEIFGSIQFIAYGFGSWVNMENSASFDKDLFCGIYIQIPEWQTNVYNNVTIYPMLNEGSTALPYKQYKGTLDTLAIPEAVKSLEGYGLGLNTEYYNYIDFERKVFVQKIKEVVFTGDETVEKYPYGNYDSVIRFIGAWFDDGRPESVGTGHMLCSHFNIGQLKPNCVSIGSGNRRGSFWIDPSFFTTETTNAEYEATLKAWLAEQYANGNPVTVVYELATPIETDISAYLTDEYIEVEGGGTISAVNEYNYDAPTNISYLIDRQGG